MAEIGISLVGKLIEVVGSEAITQICSIWNYESELNDLKDTIKTIKGILVDAELSKDQLDNEVQDYIHKLNDAVYEADDLFDEIHTLAKIKQHNKGAKFAEKVHNFFSPKKYTSSVAYSMSKEVKKITKKLEGIARDHNTFKLGINTQRIRERREDTCSYVYSRDVIVGRENDLNTVIQMLLNSGSQDSVSFLSIVGMGGMGKTTLAQLVFNDCRVKEHFSLKIWTCVSDENGKEFDVKTILTKILELPYVDNPDSLSMESVHKKLLGFLGGKKYLIVLDDVWNEDLEKWRILEKYLMSGGGGSRVLVTTRSERTATVVNKEHKYELKGLSPENSWLLFEMTAFEGKDRQDVDYAELIKLGKKIVEQCSNVPLAIKVVGTLLYGQKESKWRLFQECEIWKLKDVDNKIISILKLSYDNLESPLKTCFSYCALFPKDFIINKEKLIRLWMAQGYIVPLEVGQSLEDAGEEYISILLRRCFFQNVEKNDIGGVDSFKIHDLIHDVAQKVVGKGVVVVSSVETNSGDEAHHLFHIGSKCKGSIFSRCRIRSYVRDGFDINFQVAQLVKNWKFLRTLDLHDLDMKSLPKSIGKLLHLRYLDLSRNRLLVALPKSVTKLYNLQTLDLRGCSNLCELPKDLAKLVNLRHLDLDGCYKLSCLPSGLDKLSCLCVLTEFVVGEGCSVAENLQALKNLRGSIKIRIRSNLLGDIETSEGYMRSMKCLEVLAMELSRDIGNHEILLEKLEPPSSLKKLHLHGYNEATLPSRWWGVGKEDNLAAFLPNLVEVYLIRISNVLRLPSLSKLLHLKSLALSCTDKLEYIEDYSSYNDSCKEVFFPSLETLYIMEMSELKGWWRRDDVHSCNGNWQPAFSQLSWLVIRYCEKLTFFPACLRLEKLTLNEVNKELRITSSHVDEVSIKLKEVTVDDLDYLKSWPTDGLITICIADNNNIESLSELRETFKGCVSLRSLAFVRCRRLRSLEGAGWEHLTALDSLQLSGLDNLTFSEPKKDDDSDDDNDGMVWRSIGGRLRSLYLSWFYIETIPQEIRHLTALENLTIYECSCLTGLPKWISSLSSLRTLRISQCNKLQLDPGMVRELSYLQLLEVKACPLVTKRFQDPDWEDLLNIPFVDIRA